MKKLILSILIGITAQSAIAQNQSFKRPTGDFNSINVSGGANVVLIQSDVKDITVSCAAGDEKGIVTEIKDNTLFISGASASETEFAILVSYPTYENIKLEGSSNLGVKGLITASNLKIETEGAAEAIMNISCENLKVKVDGASVLVLKGVAQNASINADGASSLKAYGLDVKNADVVSDGASSVRVNCKDKLTVKTDGASKVKYSGNPINADVNQCISCEVKKVKDEDAKDYAAKSEAPKSDSTTAIKIGKNKAVVFSKDKITITKGETVFFGVDNKASESFGHWAGLELGMNGFGTKDYTTTLPANSSYMDVAYGMKSLNCNLNLMEKTFKIYRNNFGLTTGLGFSFNSYQFKNKTHLYADSSFTGFYNDSLIPSFEKNKLKMSYLQIPLMFEYNSSNKTSNDFHISAGVIGGLKLTSKTKQIYEINNYDYEVIRKDDYNISPFKLDATVRVGYKDFTAFATYALTPLFQKNKGPELYPFTVGIRIVPF